MTSQNFKATLFRVASFFLLLVTMSPSGAFAEFVKKNRESTSDIIQKSQNLLLQKNRLQAIDLLVKALKNEKPNSSGYNELRKNLIEISRIFISDKAQQTYEFSLSLKKTDAPQALTKINEAVRMEPENFALLFESARQNLIKNDCKAALEIGHKIQKMNPLDDELGLLMSQIKMCQNELTGSMISKDSFSTPHVFAWWSLEVERNIKEKNFLKAKEALSQLKKVDKNYPEQYYWGWRLDHDQKINNLDLAQKYKGECQNLSVALYRRYSLDPRLCGRVLEVEAFLKNQP